MHKNAEQTEDLLNELIDKIPFETEVQIIVAPTFINLATAVDHLEFVGIDVAAQICINQKVELSQEKSADMLQNIVNIVILGHSERRAILMKRMH
jgi:triosephosphate isomerase